MYSTHITCVNVHGQVNIAHTYATIHPQHTYVHTYIHTYIHTATVHVSVISCPGVLQQKYSVDSLGQSLRSSALYFLLQHTWTGYN